LIWRNFRPVGVGDNRASAIQGRLLALLPIPTGAALCRQALVLCTLQQTPVARCDRFIQLSCLPDWHASRAQACRCPKTIMSNETTVTGAPTGDAPASSTATPALQPPPQRVVRHRPYEDVQALLVGTLFVALGVVLFRQAGLLTGGTAGIAFLLHYATGWNFSALFFAINLPFYWLAWRRMGGQFTLKTLAAVTLLSVFVEAIPHWIHIDALATPYAAVMGGLLAGAGMLMLFRHRASLGGLNVLVLWLQEKRGWRAGHLQMGLDCAIVLTATAFVPWQQLAWSVVGAVAMNLTLAINHRPGRYMTV